VGRIGIDLEFNPPDSSVLPLRVPRGYQTVEENSSVLPLRMPRGYQTVEEAH